MQLYVQASNLYGIPVCSRTVTSSSQDHCKGHILNLEYEQSSHENYSIIFQSI